MQKTTLGLLLFFVLLALPAAACRTPAGDPLAGSEWLVTEIAGRPAVSEAYLQFGSAGKVVGRTGVNSVGGSYQANEASLTFSPLVMTKMAGPPELMEQEQLLVDALSRVSGFRRDRTHLTLLVDGEPAIKLRQRDWD